MKCHLVPLKIVMRHRDEKNHPGGRGQARWKESIHLQTPKRRETDVYLTLVTLSLGHDSN